MIRFNEFGRDPVALREAERAAFDRVRESGWYILGREVERFEAAWAERCGVDACVGVGNGMDAIELGLRASGLGPGDEVITTPMTAFASVLGILRAGATPVLADIDPGTALLDPASAERCVGERTRAVLLVHLYGQAADLDRWRAWCDARGLLLLEDCAQAHGARWSGRPVGSWGRWGAFSFYPTKNLGAIGDGGALVTDDAALAERARVLRNYGQSRRYHHPVLGTNSRLDELQAALLAARLAWLDELTERRRAVARRYWRGIGAPGIELLAEPAEAERHVHHLFVLRAAARDALAEHLARRGIETLIHYPIPVHCQEPTRALRRDPAGLAHTERHARECLSLPCHPHLTDEEVAQVIAAVNDFGNGG